MEGHFKQISLACVGSAHSVWTILGLPQLMAVCTFRVYTAHAPGCTAGALYQVDPAFHALPRYNPLRFRFSGDPQGPDSVGHAFCALFQLEQFRWTDAWWVHCPRCPCILITSLIPATQFPGCAMRALTQVCFVSPLRSWSQAVPLLADVNHPGSQEDVVSKWEHAHSLVELASLWGRDCPLAFWLWLLHTCLSAAHMPLCLWWG